MLKGCFLIVILVVQVVAAAVLTSSLVRLSGWEELPQEIYRTSPDAYLHYNDARVSVMREQGFIVGLFIAGLCYIGVEWRIVRESAAAKKLALGLLLFVPVFLIAANVFR